MTRHLTELLDDHTAILELLMVHRDLVVGLEFGPALEALGRFEAALRRHMEIEESHLLPLYAERVEAGPGGGPEMFRLEHRNILRNLADAKALATALRDNPRAGRREVHEFLDREWMLLHLLQHHDLRERNFLYPELDQRLNDHEREELLARFR